MFCTGQENAQPPQLAGENIYIFPATKGYDGQMYHYVAHDPFMARGFDGYVDAPRVRYRRILIPLAAHALALGQDDRIDRAFLGVTLFAVFCGGYWLSVFCATAGFSEWLGFAFLLIPATLVSIDRLTVDAALAALCIAFAYYIAKDSEWRLYGVLLVAPLVRETGLLLLAGYVIALLWKRRLRAALIFSTAALPTLIWYAYVQLQTAPEDITGFSRIPFQGLAARLATPYHYPFGALVSGVSTLLDYAALIGIILAVALAIRMGWHKLWGPVECSIYVFTLFAAFLFSPGAWEEVYAFGRTLSPLLILVGLYGMQKRNWISVLPLLLVIPRTAIQFGPQVSGVLRGVL
ncbi:MAG: hypothetical protein LAP38_20090 [Acidobacteriia bacterium]|nr:hypothetical protein [Terriglobia bacterium]